MAKYVDGFIVPVQKKRLAEYRKLAALGAKVWMEHGAVEYQENVADDVKVGKWTSFPRSVKLKAGEVVGSRGSATSRARIAIASTRR